MLLLSDDFYGNAWEAFNALDTNSDWFISRKELRRVGKLSDKPLTADEADALFEIMDVDKNGRIDFHEFATAYARGIKEELRR